jgi:glycosyltransferase involved in cell wall biosynthesis
VSRSDSNLRVALVMVAMGDLTGSGGAERQFSDVFAYLRTQPGIRAQLITSAASMQRLRDAGRLLHGDDVVALPLGPRPASSKPGIVWLTLHLLLATIGRGLDVVHICLPTPSYVPYAAIAAWLPRSWRPAITFTVIDCTLASNLTGGTPADRYEQQVLDAHRWYARWTSPDGIYSWYEAFTAAARALGIFSRSRIVSARYCFTDPDRFRPGGKQPVIVWAGRLSAQKRPLLFVDAVASLRQRYGALSDGWRFEMYGAGALEAAVRERIRTHRLDHIMVLSKAADLSPVFAITKLFVSTQALENFTSLAMLEAMAAGNAIVAEHAGQTALFVGADNGYLVSEPTAAAFADAMARYLNEPRRHQAMAEASRALATDVHTIEHFTADLTAFWRQAAA